MQGWGGVGRSCRVGVGVGHVGVGWVGHVGVGVGWGVSCRAGVGWAGHVGWGLGWVM